jgi:hypothetical protein
MVQNWIKKRYLKMLGEFRDGEFSFQDTVEFSGEVFGDDENQVKNILSELRKVDFWRWGGAQRIGGRKFIG